MKLLGFVLFSILLIASSEEVQEDSIDIPVDKGLSDYVSWWQNILGFPSPTEEPEAAVTPVDIKTCPSCECGIAKKTKIVGGQTVQLANAYPWIGGLYYKGRFYCGSTLINSKYVLTAAHCVHHFDKKQIIVRLMDHDRSAKNKTHIVERKVARIVKHMGYSASTFNNDIALIELSEPVDIAAKPGKNSLTPSPVCLPPEGKSFSGEDGIVIGWGSIKSGGPASNVLNEVMVPIMSNDECKKTGYGEKRITQNMLCAGHAEGGKDSCQGDSGGPLKIVSNNIHSIVGVVSWGEGCAEKNYPGVYTRVNRYLNWINSKTADACPCPHKSEQ